MNAHWIKNKLVVTRYELAFDKLCTNDLDITMEVTKVDNSELQSNPKLMMKASNIHIVTTDLPPAEYEISIKAELSNGSIAGYIEMIFDYNVEKSIYMIFISILYYLMFGLITLDALILKKYVLLRNFLFASQLIHLCALCSVYIPPSALYFAQNTVVSMFMHPLMTRSLMNKPSEAHSEMYYNIGYESVYVIIIAISFTVFVFLSILAFIFTIALD